MRQFALIAISCLLLLTLSMCKKYPEDRKISLKSPLKRISAHPWKISKIQINGADSTYHSFSMPDKNIFNIILANTVFDFKNSKSIYSSPDHTNYDFIWENPPFNSDNKIWYTENKKKNISFIIGLVNNESILHINPNNNSWEIKKLTSTEFHVELEEKSIMYRIEFIAQ